jgi:hypothetical protein
VLLKVPPEPNYQAPNDPAGAPDGGGSPPPPANNPASTPAPPAVTPNAVAKPEKLDAKYWDTEKSTIKLDDLVGELTTLQGFKAEADIRALGVPKDGAYKLDLSGFTPPEGVEIKIDENHGLMKPAREFAAKHGLTAEAFNELGKIYAAHEAERTVSFNREIEAEREKLGANGAQRIGAVKTALAGRIGEKAKALIAGMVTAEQTEAYEALLRTMVSTGPAPTPPAPKADYAKMTLLQRLAHAHEVQAARAKSGRAA